MIKVQFCYYDITYRNVRLMGLWDTEESDGSVDQDLLRW